MKFGIGQCSECGYHLSAGPDCLNCAERRRLLNIGPHSGGEHGRTVVAN